MPTNPAARNNMYDAPPTMEIDPTRIYVATIETEKGDIEIELFADKAPNTVNNFVFLARQGFYDGIVFHRVIDGFMAQTGDPTGTGMGGSGQKLKAEFNSLPHARGTLSMARSNHPDSADSQFFIVFKAAPFLNGQYTVWGRVVAGMEFVDNIKKGDPQSGLMDNPDKIVSMKVAADVKE